MTAESFAQRMSECRAKTNSSWKRDKKSVEFIRTKLLQEGTQRKLKEVRYEVPDCGS